MADLSGADCGPAAVAGLCRAENRRHAEYGAGATDTWPGHRRWPVLPVPRSRACGHVLPPAARKLGRADRAVGILWLPPVDHFCRPPGSAAAAVVYQVRILVLPEHVLPDAAGGARRARRAPAGAAGGG